MVRRKDIAKAQDPLDDKPVPFRLGEIGVSGSSIVAGLPQDELKRELNFPYNIKTFKQMMLHPAVNASISLYKSMLSKATFRVVPVKNATAKERKQAELIDGMLKDMETPLEDVISEALSCLEYGFAPVEKVFRLRDGTQGGVYKDGLIGIKKLSLRNQESILRFEFDEDGNDVVNLVQSLSKVHDPFGRYSKRASADIVIPRSKFLLFTTGSNKGSPYGTSPLRNVYLPWKYLQAIEELEASGVAKDLQGIPYMKLPAAYMSEEASPENKASLEKFKNILRNLQQNSQAGVMLPSDVDPETKTPLFDIELLTSVGKKSFDTEKIKDYYRVMIFIGLSADILLIGNTQTGSFALGAIKNSLTGTAVEGYLKNIVKIFNTDLIKHLYELNNWDLSRRCSLDFENFGDIDLDSYSKAIQRIASVGILPITLDVVNDVLGKLGLDNLPANTKLEDVLSSKTSRSGDGMKTAGEGTSTDPSGTDTSSMNVENA